MENKRDITFDMMKGIAILAMIAAHCFIPLKLHHFIYIWHMPLFFIVSGYFFRDKPFGKMMKDNIRGLLLPYIVCSGIILCGALLMDLYWNTHMLIPKFVGTLAINGLMQSPDVYGGLYKSSPLWFLLGLFWCRVIYSILYRCTTNFYVQGIFCIVLSWTIAVFHDKIYLPFYILQGLVSVIFYNSGHVLKRNIQFVKSHKRPIFVLTAATMIMGMLQQGLDIWALWFHNWPLNVVAAVGTTVLIYISISHLTRKIDSGGANICLWLLSHIGRWSLLILALHSFEKSLDVSTMLLSDISLLNENSLAYRLIKICFQFGFCIMGLIILERINIVRRLFNVK